MVGTYVPMLRYARNEDCYSHFWDLASSSIGYHKYFDGIPFDRSKKFNLALELVFDSATLLDTFNTCTLQWNNEQKSGWLNWYQRTPHALSRTDGGF